MNDPNDPIEPSVGDEAEAAAREIARLRAWAVDADTERTRLAARLDDARTTLAEHADDCEQHRAHLARPGRVGACSFCALLGRIGGTVEFVRPTAERIFPRPEDDAAFRQIEAELDAAGHLRPPKIPDLHPLASGVRALATERDTYASFAHQIAALVVSDGGFDTLRHLGPSDLDHLAETVRARLAEVSHG